MRVICPSLSLWITEFVDAPGVFTRLSFENCNNHISKMTYQYLVISINDERKDIMKKQVLDLELNAPVHFLPNVATISNSTEYLPKDETIETQKVLCCALSHIRALEYACHDSSPDFTVICEDDVAMHKFNFTNCVEEIITNWSSLIYPNKMALIGWIPVNNYTHYTKIHSDRSLKSLEDSKLLSLSVYGMQAYIVRKCDILPLIKHFVHPTFEEMRNHINSMNFPHLEKYYEMKACDGFINKILGSTVLFPPLCIEQDTPSTLGHNDTNFRMWKYFFENNASVKKNYYSFE